MKLQKVVFPLSGDELRNDILASAEGHSRFVVLVDENTAQCCLPALITAVPELSGAEIIEVEAGEDSKAMELVTHLIDHLIEIEADKDTFMILLGGGVVTDLGAFVASIYKRGIAYINIPTSLMGMVDAASGGKNGVNHKWIKNVIGTISFPKSTVIHTPFLSTLPETELQSGFAEMLKHGLIRDALLWQALKEVDSLNYEHIALFVKKALEIKLQIIEHDPYEKGIRKHLNFGHTIGHGLESIAFEKGINITHGHAIAIGMVLETMVASRLGFCSALLAEEVQDYIFSKFTKREFEGIDFTEVLPYLLQDKKNAHGKIALVALKEAGSVAEVTLVEQTLIAEVWRDVLG